MVAMMISVIGQRPKRSEASLYMLAALPIPVLILTEPISEAYFNLGDYSASKNVGNFVALLVFAAVIAILFRAGSKTGAKIGMLLLASFSAIPTLLRQFDAGRAILDRLIPIDLSLPLALILNLTLAFAFVALVMAILFSASGEDDFETKLSNSRQ